MSVLIVIKVPCIKPSKKCDELFGFDLHLGELLNVPTWRFSPVGWID